MKLSKFVLSCAVSPEKITSCDPGPKMRDQCVMAARFRRFRQRLAGIIGRRKCLLRSFRSGGLLW